MVAVVPYVRRRYIAAANINAAARMARAGYRAYRAYSNRRRNSTIGANRRFKQSTTEGPATVNIPRPVGGCSGKRVVQRSKWLTNLSYSTLGNAIEGYRVISFTLSDLSGYAEFAGIYESYRINWVELAFIPSQNAYNALQVSTNGNAVLGASASAETGSAPGITYACDKYDVTAPANQQEILDIAGASVYRFTDGQTLKVRIKPLPIDEVGSTGSTVQKRITRAPFVKTTATTLQHYGFKAWCWDFFSPNTVDVLLTINVTFSDSY